MFTGLPCFGADRWARDPGLEADVLPKVELREPVALP